MTLEENDIAHIQGRMLNSGTKLGCWKRSENMMDGSAVAENETRPLPSSAPYYTDNGLFPA